MWGLLLSLGNLWRIAGGGGGEQITLSSTTIAESAAIGDLVGTLSVANGSGSYAFTMDVNDEFVLDGVDDTRVEVKALLTPGTYIVTVQADNGVDPPLEQNFSVTVTALARAAPTFAWTDTATSDTTPGFTFGIPSGNGNYLDGQAGDTAEVPVDNVLWASHVLTPQNFIDGTVALSGATPLAEGARVGKARLIRPGGPASDYSATDSVTIDATAPTLSSPSGTTTGATTADLAVTTNEANGTLYGVVTTSSTSPSAAQVKAGQNHSGAAATFADDQTIASTGVKTFSATGLTAETEYWPHFMHEDAVGNQSAVSTGASFTTDVVTADGYELAVLALTPSGYWQFDEAAGSSSFADLSGNSLTATGTGKYFSGCVSQIPAAPRRKSLCLAGLGHAALASSSTFNKTSLTAMSFAFTFTRSQGDATTYIPFSKFDAATTKGFQAVIYSDGGIRLEFGVYDGANKRTGRCTITDVPTGQHHCVITWDGNTSNNPKIYIDGVSQTVTANNAGSGPTNIGNSAVFRMGGRSDGFHYGGVFQDFAVWDTTELTAGNVTTLYSAHNTADTSQAIPMVLDTDGASSDIGDLPGVAHVIHWHRMGIINLLGICVTAGDIYAAPAVRACLDWYGLTAIPVGAYKGTDVHVGAGGGSSPAKTIRDAFDATGSRDDATYDDPVTFYDDILTGQADDSVVVVWGGFANSIADFLNDSAANATLWNDKVKLVGCIAGQWPNSSSSASPAGNFNITGRGEWNLGGSDSGATGANEAQAAVDFIALSTVPHYWHGVEICGNVGDDPLLSNFIVSRIPGAWATTNPLRLGFGNTTRTAWDEMGGLAALEIALNGLAGNPHWTGTQIATPTIDVSGADQGHNSSSAGSSNNWYLVPNSGVGSMSAAEWRTAMARQVVQLMPRET
jgi:hypothetical protein